MTNDEYQIFIREQLLNLIDISKYLSRKYTKSKVRKSLPKAFSYIIQELMFEKSTHTDKTQYYDAIINAIFKTKRERNFLIELSYFIQRLTIDRLHIVGDIFDRGPSAHLVMNKIIKYHSVDIEWGNHDILWMGAACGSKLAICNVLRNSARYNTLDTLEDGYGINLLPLARYASKYYQDDDCTIFLPKNDTIKPDIDKEQLVAKMHKAIAIIQFKLEGLVFRRNPNFDLNSRLLLEDIDYTNGTITIDDVVYPLKDSYFPTIDQLDPYKLTEEEENLLAQLKNAFLNNDLLQSHIEFLFQNGHMFLKYNNNLLFHGCIPLNPDGTFSKVNVDGKDYFGKELFNILETKLRVSFLHRHNKKSNNNNDYFIFLWQGEHSPLFGKKDMKTFERYFIKDKKSHYEEMNNYFLQREDETILKNIYIEFKIDYNKSKIINGHVPNDISAGDRPILANGRIYAIDGGMSKAYASRISIGGYTLVIDSYKIFLMSHERFTTTSDIIEREQDIISLNQSEEVNIEREYLYDTDKGKKLKEEIDDLYKLLDAYRDGLIKEYLKEKQSHMK